MTTIAPNGTAMAPLGEALGANLPRCGRVVAACVSGGGIPKRPVDRAWVTLDGLAGDAHAHDKHIRADRAVSLFDIEILEKLVTEGFALSPGAAGENLTLAGLDVQSLPAGTCLAVGEVVLRLEAPRKPCYVLDAIDPRLQKAIVGRCGYMASVVHEGLIEPGMSVEARESPTGY
jgi:MOSC domain-containing protein YiiM